MTYSNSQKDMILFYAERIDRNGHKHYAVNRYNRVTGYVAYPSDYFFDKLEA